MSQTSVIYGNALYELARDEQLSETILSQYAQVLALFAANPDYLRLVDEPSVSKQERCALLQEAFGASVHEYLLSFLKLLCEKGYIRTYKSCFAQYRSRFNEDHDILEATAITAVPLSDALRDKLLQKLESVTGKQIDLRLRTDASVLGGIRLQLDGKQLDGTVRRRLDTLRRSLSDTVL